jgi:hypothetical protein
MQQQPQGPRAVEQQTRTCSQQQLLKLELLHILVDMRKANQKSSVRHASGRILHRSWHLATATAALLSCTAVDAQDE